MRSTDFPFAVMPQRYAVRRMNGGGMANTARSVGQGLTFGTADEIEAFLRSLAGREGYRDIKNRIEADRMAFAEANPGTSISAELAGAALPGLIGAFVPGGQGATLGALSRAARVMDAPVEAMLARMAPNVLRGLQARLPGRLGVGIADEVVTGAGQSAGRADTTEDIPAAIADEALLNAAGALAVRGGTEGVKKLHARRKRRG
jgi:hypothetical protein